MFVIGYIFVNKYLYQNLDAIHNLGPYKWHILGIIFNVKAKLIVY